MAHVRLDLHLDERRRHLRGRATLTLAPLHDGLRHLDLDLAPPLAVTAVQTDGGRPLRFEHRGDRLRIDLGREHAAGRELRLRIDYAGSPRRGLYFIGPDATVPDRPYEIWSQGQDEDSRFWFPCYDSPNDKATSEVVATVRRPFTVISNGRLVSVTEDRRRGTRTFHWREEFPHPAYLTSLVVADYVEVTDEADGVPLHYFVHRQHRDKVQRTFGNTPAMMRFFNRAIDYPYPFEKYSQAVVTDFIFGGMENISATTLTDAILLDATAALDARSDGLLAHELAHQWWGNLLTCKEWSHAWLNEGFATYFDALFTEHHRGPDEFRWQLHEFRQEYFREDEERYRRPIVERRWSKPIEIFDRHLYEKSALVLHMLRWELGDSLFWKSIRHYARKHQFQNVETADLKIAIEEATGRHLDAFFDQWVYAPGYPVIEASWSWQETPAMVRLLVRQRQDRDNGAPLYSLPIDIEIAGDDGVERRRIQVEAAEQTLFLPCERRPRWVRVDPDHWIVMKLEMEHERDSLLAQLRDTRDLFGPIDAAAGLSRFVGDAEVVAALASRLRGKRFFAVKSAAAQALGRVGGAAARDALLGALGEPDLRARRGIVRALGEFKREDPVARALRAAWRPEKSYFVRAEILTAVAKIGAPGAFELLSQGLRVESFRDVVRGAALRGLGTLEDERGLDLARSWAGYGHSRWTRDAAMKTLAGLAKLQPRRAREVQDLLESWVHDPSFFAALSAAEALGKLGRSQALPALRNLMRSEVDGRLQKAAREAIEALEAEARDPEAWRSLRSEVRGLQQENQDLRTRLDRLEAQLGPAANGTAHRPAPAARPGGKQDGRRAPRPRRAPARRPRSS